MDEDTMRTTGNGLILIGGSRQIFRVREGGGLLRGIRVVEALNIVSRALREVIFQLFLAMWFQDADRIAFPVFPAIGTVIKCFEVVVARHDFGFVRRGEVLRALERHRNGDPLPIS